MKVIRNVLLTICTLFLGSQAFAATPMNDPMLDALAETVVMQQIDAGIVVLEEDESIFDQIKQFIEETRELLLDSYDYNGNGRIDPGEELDGVVMFIESILLGLIDTDFSGTIEPEELKAFLEEILMRANEALTEYACGEVNKAAEKAGPWLPLLPLLNYWYQECQNL